MSKYRLPLVTAAAAATLALLVGCSAPAPAEKPAKTKEAISVSVGVLSRDEPDMNRVAQHLKDEGITMSVKVFDDNIAMNRATEDGSLNANYFQSASYLKSFNESNTGKLEMYGPWLHTHAVLLVSSKFDSVKAFPNGAKIGIANDTFNRSRELRLIETTGLIKLREGVDQPSVLDVVSNPKNVEFIEVDPRSRVGAFPDLDAMTAPGVTVFQMNDPSVKTLTEETPAVYKEFGGVYWVTADPAANKKWLDAAIEYMSTTEHKEWLKEEYRGLKKTP